jgi:hypothetical protein
LDFKSVYLVAINFCFKYLGFFSKFLNFSTWLHI